MKTVHEPGREASAVLMMARTSRRLLIATGIAALVAATVLAAVPGARNRPSSDSATKSGPDLAIFAAKSGGRPHAIDALKTAPFATLLLGVSLGALVFAGPALAIGTTSQVCAKRLPLHARGPPPLLL